jgi:hypothetical protein
MFREWVLFQHGCFFACLVLWPDGFDRSFESAVLVTGIAAFIALF